MKSKFIKEAVCPKCGREQHGFYINPICLCGHQFRELNGWEIKNMGCSEEEFQTLSVSVKRAIVREIEWNWVDVKWRGRFYILFLSFFTVLCAMTRDYDDTVFTVLKIIFLTMLGLDAIVVTVKTIYFQGLKRKDALFFMDN